MHRLLNLTLNLLLIPHYKAVGAAFATCLTQFGIVIAHLMLVRKTLTLSIHYTLVSRVLIYVVFVFLLNWCFVNWLSLNWAIGYLLGLVLSLLPAFSLRLISYQAALQFFYLKSVDEEN